MCDRRPPRKHSVVDGPNASPANNHPPITIAPIFTNTPSKLAMGPEVVAAWLADQQILSHPHCDPSTSDDALLSPFNQRMPASHARSQPNSSTGRSSSSGPFKSALNLCMLEKPVHWTSPEPDQLRRLVADTGSAQALRLLDDVRRAGVHGRGHLPLELKAILQPKLTLVSPDDDICFAPRHPTALAEAQKDEDRRLLVSLLDDLSSPEGVSVPAAPPAPGIFDRALHLLALRDELKAIRAIVATTARYKTTPRSEAAWNERVHGPMLSLAVRNVPGVAAENVTRANIARTLIPPAPEFLDISFGGKMIDYALLLQLDGVDNALANGIAKFVGRLEDLQTFNQSMHGSLCTKPSGVFVETKVEARRYAEGKAQLGLWLAAWFGRVASFPRPSAAGASGSGSGSTGKGASPNKLPFMPILLVVCDVWELFFAFDRDDAFEVCGPLNIGSTNSLDGAYRLQAVLRLLAGWVAGGFRDWVSQCVAPTA